MGSTMGLQHVFYRHTRHNRIFTRHIITEIVKAGVHTLKGRDHSR
jgi:hypothetical protein